MLAIAIFLYFVCFVSLAWVNFRWAIGLFIVLFPAYIVRIDLFKLPSTILELSFFAILAVWIIKYFTKDWVELKKIILERKVFFILFLLFFAASIGSIFVAGLESKTVLKTIYQSVGQWRAYFLEPMLFFIIVISRRKEIRARDLVWFFSLSAVSVSVYSFIQEFTGWGIATAEWTNVATRRVTAFFLSPNAVGLFLEISIVLMVAFIYYQHHLSRERNLGGINPVGSGGVGRWLLSTESVPSSILMIFSLVIALLAVFFTKSEGTWVALIVALLIFFYLVGYKNIVTLTIIAGIIVFFSVPPVQHAILFERQSGQNRLELWSYSLKYLTASPQHFFLGTGIGRFFSQIQKPFYDPKKMERLIYPHNIFLNFWTETGFLGMLSFLGLLFYLGILSVLVYSKEKVIGSGLLAGLVVLLIHGFVDVPYFKNDLAFIFWLFAAIIILYASQKEIKTAVKAKHYN